MEEEAVMEIYLTVHAKHRMYERIISEAEIVEALSYGAAEQNKEVLDTFVIDYGKVRIIFTQIGSCIRIVTVMESRTFKKQLKKYVKTHKISYRKATKELKNVA